MASRPSTPCCSLHSWPWPRSAALCWPTPSCSPRRPASPREPCATTSAGPRRSGDRPGSLPRSPSPTSSGGSPTSSSSRPSRPASPSSTGGTAATGKKAIRPLRSTKERIRSPGQASSPAAWGRGRFPAPPPPRGLQWIAGGALTGYGGQRQGMYTNNAYPDVSYPAAQWSDQIRHEGNASWLQADAVRPEFNLRLMGWNLLYLLAGRDVGILPYFLPLLLGFLAFRPDRGRWALPLAVAAAALAFL